MCRSSSFAADKCSSYNPLTSSRSSSISDLSSTNANNKTVVKIDKDGTHNSTRYSEDATVCFELNKVWIHLLSLILEPAYEAKYY